MEKRTFILAHDQARQNAIQFIAAAPRGMCVKVTEADRTLDQNSAQWPILDAFSKQKKWPVNGELCWLTPEEWKDVLTAGYEKELTPRLASGISGGVVMLGHRTSKYSKPKFSEWLEFLHAAAAQLGVSL